jgi:hypothetical protein
MKKSSRQNSAGKRRPKKGAPKKPRAAGTKQILRVAPALGPNPLTVARVIKIIASYGIVPDPSPGTIVGPAVVSMGQFTVDVNQEFGREYRPGQLKAAWTVNQTSYYIDTNP